MLGSEEGDDATAETAHLLRNARAAERLLASLERARRGEFETRELAETLDDRVAPSGEDS